MKLTFGPNWMRSPLGIVSSRLSSNTEFSDSTHSGSMSPSQITHERTSGGSRTTLRADAVSTPSNHSRVSISMWPRSCSRGVRVRVRDAGWGVGWRVGCGQRCGAELCGVACLLARHRLRIHHVRRYLLAELEQGGLEHLPDRRLAAARRADDDDAHSLLRRLVELQDLLHLQRQHLELLGGHHLWMEGWGCGA